MNLFSNSQWKNKGTKSKQSIWKIYGLTRSSVQKDLIIFIKVPNIPENYLLRTGHGSYTWFFFYCRTTMATACYNGISQFLCEFWWHLLVSLWYYINRCKCYFEEWIYSTGCMVCTSTAHSFHATLCFLFWIKRLKLCKKFSCTYSVILCDTNTDLRTL